MGIPKHRSVPTLKEAMVPKVSMRAPATVGPKAAPQV